MMLGDHLIGFWPRTQQCVALSSCEAEVNALIKGGTEGLGLKIMAPVDFGDGHMYLMMGRAPKFVPLIVRPARYDLSNMSGTTNQTQRDMIGREEI